MKVILSSGSYKFHMAPLAVEHSRFGILAGFITAGYPIGWQRWLAERFSDHPSWRRFLDRRETIPDALVHSSATAEFLLKVPEVLLRSSSKRLEQVLQRAALDWYAHQASKVLRASTCDVYHFRNAYGRGSVQVARDLGAVVLCDHSIAHPLCLAWMEQNKGSWPNPEKFARIEQTMLPLYQDMAADLLDSDHVLVNSDFVKRTCVFSGMSENRVHVVYLGVDDDFFSNLIRDPAAERAPHENLLFAGGWQERKGVHTLVDALYALPRDWRLTRIGGEEPGIWSGSALQKFKSDARVSNLGTLTRSELALRMQQHRIFVFPSYCEGSARVVFEAMAAGCFIITTENSGSIVEDQKHGFLVEAGNSADLRDAIERALDSPDWVDEIGRSNAELVATHYRQRDYGERVRAVYERLINERAQ